MAKVITFSRTFPAYHPRKGHPTYFVEKFIKSAHPNLNVFNRSDLSFIDSNEMNKEFFNTSDVKHHTIRAGHRWKAGDYFSPRVWSGKPYNSQMITIAPDTLIAKTWDFDIKDGLILINNEVYAYSSSTDLLDKLASNDGLSQINLLNWFKYPKPFSGQIICWNPNINY